MMVPGQPSQSLWRLLAGHDDLMQPSPSASVTAITIESVARTFGAVRAVDYVSLAVRDGEFFTLLGPSGCGKTTLLRMVAGFCELDRGRILFGEERIDTLPPHRRNTGMVFQNYAVFPNLNVGDNVAYGLRARKSAGRSFGSGSRSRSSWCSSTDLAPRWPHQLSGGQLQRVAIARAVVIEPHVLLLDEPLSNLDAKLRVEMRGEIRALQKTLGITVIYVTHDQEEALAISDRIAVMRAGRVEQVADPPAIYERPETAFVASFVGITNLLEAQFAAVKATPPRSHSPAPRCRRAACRATQVRGLWCRCGPRRCACSGRENQRPPDGRRLGAHWARSSILGP